MKKIVLNLERRKDRKESFNRDNIDKLGDYEFLKAIDGRDITLPSLYNQGIIPLQGWRDPFHNKKIRKGEIGCFLSHFNAWQRCIKEDEPIMVLEDDAIINENFDEFEMSKESPGEYM